MMPHSEADPENFSGGGWNFELRWMLTKYKDIRPKKGVNKSCLDCRSKIVLNKTWRIWQFLFTTIQINTVSLKRTIFLPTSRMVCCLLRVTPSGEDSSFQITVTIAKEKKKPLRELKQTLTVRKIWDSITKPVKRDTVWQTALDRCDVSSEPWCPGAEPRRWAPPFVTRFGVLRWLQQELIFFDIFM